MQYEMLFTEMQLPERYATQTISGCRAAVSEDENTTHDLA
jgi:hypothetical protein